MRFLGNIEAKTDTKGRAFLPASFRKVLTASGEDTLVLRQDVFENLLVLYPQRVWNQLMDDMRSRLSRWDRKQQMAFRTLVSSVMELSIDGNGRILFPRNYLDAIGVVQKIRFVGMGDTIEVWPNEDNSPSPIMDKQAFGQILEQQTEAAQEQS
jgi:MraZ protein